MDNFHIDVTGDERHELALAIQIGFSRRRTATHYVKHPELGFIFLSGAEKDAVELPVALGPTAAVQLVLLWLDDEATSYPKEPRHDGENRRGWRVYNEEWGHVGGYTRAIVAVQPFWAMYGK